MPSVPRMASRRGLPSPAPADLLDGLVGAGEAPRHQQRQPVAEADLGEQRGRGYQG
jgi:hypothetical protein